MRKLKIPNAFCGTCNQHFYKKPSEILKSKSGKVYCSKICAALPCRREKPCIICGTMILGGACKKTCSPECAKTYQQRPGKIYSSRRPKTQKAVFASPKSRMNFIEFRGSKCELCPYSIKEILNIHHILERKNGGTDEELNLIVVCPNCHTEIHKGIRKIESCKSGN
jgi:hypothetical protein